MNKNKAEKALRWVVNTIPDFEPKTNEEKMLLAIKLYSEAGAEEIKRLEAENAALRERLSKAYEFPVKYGDRIWVIGKSHLFDRYVWGIEIKNNGIFLSLSDKTMWYDRGIVPLSECGKTWFLDSEKELAEARMKELQGD